MKGSEDATEFDPGVGQCSICAFAAVQGSARGSRFWRCLRADSEERFLRYPPLPVVDCPGYSERGADRHSTKPVSRE
jgi:hypothetical protein